MIVVFYYDLSIYALLFNFSNSLHYHEHFQILLSYKNNYDLVSLLILSFGTRSKHNYYILVAEYYITYSVVFRFHVETLCVQSFCEKS